jgi:hypothetical protein
VVLLFLCFVGGVIKGKVVNDMLRKPTQTVVKSESEKKQLKLIKV